MLHCSDYRPSAGLLRDSLAKRSREFVLENSLHVVPYFIDPSRSIYERFVWFLIFNVSVISAAATITTIWQKFQTSPTLTYLHIERENSTLDFPNVYLCFDESHLNFSESHLTPSQAEILRALYTWKGDPPGFGKEEIGEVSGPLGRYLLRVAPDCGEFFSDCEFGQKSLDCADSFAIATPGGVCCEFLSRAIERDDSSWSLRFLPSRYPISVHVTGRPEGPPLYGQQPTYVMNGPSSIQLSLTITKTASSLRFLTRSQRKCDFPEESPSHVHCERAHIEKTFKSKCGCLPWFYASGQAEDCPLSKYQCLSEIDSKELADPNCQMSCDHTAYNCEKIERSGDSSEVRFLSWPDVRFRRSTRFGWLDLLVSFGGVAGCFLGYSIITSLEGLYYFTLRTYCGAVLAVPKSRFNVQVQPRDVKRLQGEAKERVAADGFSDQLKQRYLKDY
ncbi:hypothetical protein TSAR_013053 [Trichomalopsis sarcophagae]|uniref:Uncharacterized protein n=1 Tax=Trichomalopsis sarcophagae TaxID=543379 RepID=A0A232EIZ0_9HYME|nr:hypothetical protein TSAR_013053 [Trichomalopsis sarcophagae]